jgi:DNA-binding transcriptional LysR family regulator
MVASGATIDLNLVSMFVRVVEAGSFTAAASQLGLRKSSISRGVSRLEEELGVRLLHRTTRRLNMTEAGRAYFARVRELTSSIDEATTEVREMGHEPQGTVRLTAVPDSGSGLLADIIARFVRQYPKIRVELVLTSRSVDLIEEGIDLALRAGVLRDSPLVARKIAPTPLALFAAPSYLRRRGRPKTLRELARHDCVLYRPQGGKSTWRLTGPKGDESVEVTGSIASDDMGFNAHAVVAGAGVGLLPMALAVPTLEQSKLARILADYTLTGGAVYIVAPPSRHQLLRVRLLRDFLASALLKEWKLPQ